MFKLAHVEICVAWGLVAVAAWYQRGRISKNKLLIYVLHFNLVLSGCPLVDCHLNGFVVHCLVVYGFPIHCLFCASCISSCSLSTLVHSHSSIWNGSYCYSEVGLVQKRSWKTERKFKILRVMRVDHATNFLGFGS